MGVVPMKVVGSFSHRGSVCLTYAVYIYCDNCGSFNIKKELSIRQWLLVISSFLLTATILFWGSTPLMLDSEDWIILVLCFIGIGLIDFVLWGRPAYRCRKCRNFTTIRYNTRNYSSGLVTVDVSDQLIQTFGLRGWPEDQPIEAYLNPPVNAKRK
jgi:hypothetical protein